MAKYPLQTLRYGHDQKKKKNLDMGKMLAPLSR